MSDDPLSVPRTAAGRLRELVLAVLGCPRSPGYWRLLHWLIGRRAVIATTALAISPHGSAESDDILNRFWELVVSSGWPRHARGWHNADVARFVWRVRRRAARAPQVRKRRPRARDRSAVRVACVGPFAHLTSFGTPEFFTPDLPDLELHVFEFAYRGVPATGYLAGRVASYEAYSEDDRVGPLAEDVNAIRPDLVIIFRALDGRTFDLVDALDAPCVAYACTGASLLYHEGVDFFIHGQPQADYFVKDERLFSGIARMYSGRERVFAGDGFYDPEGLDPTGTLGWHEREAKLVVHGSLYKTAAPEFLDVLLTLLAEDADLSLVLMGKDDGHALSRIRLAADRRRVAERVHYEGAFSPVRADRGSIDDPMRARMLDHLRTARLAPDPFPLGGASTRIEAYGTGAPSVHLALRMDPESWARPQPATADVPFLNVDGGTAIGIDGYVELCRRCLYDGAHADRLAAAQAETFYRLTDPTRWWAEKLGFYGRWLASAGDGKQG